MLGLASDPATRALYPTAGHRCFARGGVAAVAPEHQRRYCLGADYRACPLFTEPIEAPVVLRQDVAVPPRLVVRPAICMSSSTFTSTSSSAATG